MVCTQLLNLDLQTDENKRGIDFERRLCHDGAADIHERVEDLTQRGGGSLEHDNERGALEAFVRQVQQSNDAI